MRANLFLLILTTGTFPTDMFPFFRENVRGGGGKSERETWMCLPLTRREICRVVRPGDRPWEPEEECPMSGRPAERVLGRVQ